MPFTVTMPKLSPTMETGTIAKWHKKEGDLVNAGDLLLEVSTDKATVEHTALDEGYLRKIVVPDGQDAQVNQPIAIFTESADESIDGYTPEGAAAVKTKTETPEIKAAVAAPSPAKEQTRILASPLAKKIAKQQGIDLGNITGSGPRGRIVVKDLKQPERVSLPSGTFEEIALSPMRKVISQRLLEAKTTIPHFYVQMAIDATHLVSFREQLLALDQKVTYNDCIIKASALALREHPVLNSGFNAANQSLVQYKTIDISVAVSVEGGLITPIVKHADQKNLSQISSEVQQLAKKAKEGKLAPQEFQGGSFTISNLGMYGVTQFQAIINPPQAAILAVSAILDQPVVKNGTIVPGKIMNLTLSADHRVVDGVAAAKFLNTLQKYLENPVALFSNIGS